MRLIIFIDGRGRVVYQAVANAVQVWSGRSCYWLAQQCAVIALLTIVISLWNSKEPVVSAGFGVGFGVFWLLVAVGTGFIEQAWRRNPSMLPAMVLGQHQPTAVVARVFLCMFYLGFMVAGRNAPSTNIADVAVVSHLYFLCCVPMPPSQAREKRKTGWRVLVPVIS